MHCFDPSKLASNDEISKIVLYEVLKKRTLLAKISFLGAYGVGKSTFQENIFEKGSFTSSLPGIPETGVKNLTLLGLDIHLQCWIMPAYPQKSLLNFLRGSSLVVILYDITNFNTISNIDELILQVKNVKEDIPIILVGNKLDLEDKRDVPKSTVIELCKNKNLFAYYEISSKTCENTEDLFYLIARILLKEFTHPWLEKEEKDFIKTKPKRKRKKGKEQKKKDHI